MSQREFRIPVVLFGLAVAGPAAAQSTPGQASAISIAPSVELASVVLEAVPAGSELVVRGVEVVGASVLVTVVVAATGASFVIEVTAEVARSLSLVAGTVVEAVAVSGGTLLRVSGEVLCFIADAATRGMVHHRRLGP